MSIAVIQQKLMSYECQNPLEQEHALKEIMQEIALSSLARTDFFRIAAFQGGTVYELSIN